MKRLCILLAAGLFLSPASCDSIAVEVGDVLAAIFSPRVVTVVLDNQSPDFDVNVVLFTSDQQDIPEDLIDDLGDRDEFRLAPGDRVQFSRDCDDLQAIMIDDADLLVIGQIGPEDDTGVLRDGDDFGCGDRITFTFTHTDNVFDFHIETAVED